MEEEMKMSMEGERDVLDVDSPWDFSMYFKDFNPENIRNRRNMGNRRRTTAKSVKTLITLMD
jgi:hypothetical protein